MKKYLILLLVLAFICSHYIPVLAKGKASAEYLCEIARDYYKRGRFADALHEFNKALIIDPKNETAKKYINLIAEQEALFGKPIAARRPVLTEPSESILKYLSTPLIASPIAVKGKKKTEYLMAQEIARVKGIKEVSSVAEKGVVPKKAGIPKVIALDDSFQTIKFPLEIQQGKSVIVRGQNIVRFLPTQPDILAIERISSDEIQVTGKNLGYTYLHVWDSRDRWTLEFLVTPPKALGPTIEEEMKKEEEVAKNIRLRYSFDWSSFETGRRLDSLKRTSHSASHNIGFAGDPETPYGNLVFGLSVSSLQDQTTDVNYFSLGLTKGKIGSLRDFNLFTFDYNPAINNLAFSGVNLRGVMLNSPAFNKKVEYTTFWGREGGGRYAGLSPGLSKIRNSFLSGLDFNYLPIENKLYGFSVVHGWGRERLADLNPYGYDLRLNHNYDKWDWRYEVAHDTANFSHLLGSSLKLKKGSIGTEFRDMDNNFKTLTGTGSRVGEIGILTNFTYQPFEKFGVSSRLDIFKDKLYPNPEHPDYLNQDFNLSSNLHVDDLTGVSSDYSFQNYLGRVSAFRSHGFGLGLNRSFEWVRKINTNINYSYTINKYFTSPNLDYQSNKILSGLRFNIIGSLSYFASEELSFVKALNMNETAEPRAFETGVDWSRKIFDTPFYGNMRFSYRDEENTESPFSFLSGEDYIEGSTEIRYKPNPDVEVFANTRVRNVWAEKLDVKKRIDLNFYTGLRYLWDTGIHWDPAGSVEGLVFKDYNADGIRQNDEPPVEGIKLWQGKKKFQVTDLFGAYKFKKVRARKVYVNIDTTTLPAGFVLTVPATQEAPIEQGKTVQLNFGIISRTEIGGLVFEDTDGDGQFSSVDRGVSGVSLWLEDGSKAVTNESGKYSFRKLTEGVHKIRLDLPTVPSMYIPTVPIFKEVEVKEGSSVYYNIPLKRTN